MIIFIYVNKVNYLDGNLIIIILKIKDIYQGEIKIPDYEIAADKYNL